jgi:Family of unknown function (DUF5706)
MGEGGATSIRRNPDRQVERNLGPQIDFAKHNYEDQQNIIRHLDVKAGVFVTALAFFVMNAPVAGHDAIGKLRWSGAGSFSSVVYVISGAALVVSFLAAALCVQRVIRVRGFKSSGKAHGLIFASEVLQFDSAEQYHAATKEASEEVLLRNYTAQVYLLSKIVRDKAQALGATRWPTGICFCAWIVNVATALYISSWK